MTTLATEPASHQPSIGSLPDLLRRVEKLEPHDRFPDVDTLVEHFDDLERQHPDLIGSRQIATSRLGEPIRCYTIGDGARAFLIVGGVHPNEPIGSITAMHLAQELLNDRALLEASNATWHIVPNIDPDGARLNETWYAQPADHAFYARHFYRPAPDEQVEWTFPSSYRQLYFDRVLPETLGLMRLIDDVRPDLYVSLHNAEMGGVYYYVSRDIPSLVPALHAIPAHMGLPLAVGEPESGETRAVAPAIYLTGTLAESYDYLEEIGVDPTVALGGSSSSEYADRHGTLSVIAELPQWVHAGAGDDSPIPGTSYAELLRETGRELRACGEILEAILRDGAEELTLDTPFLRASRAFVPLVLNRAETMLARADQLETDRSMTVAERVSCDDVLVSFRLRYGGMLLRALNTQVDAGLAGPGLRRLRSSLANQYAAWEDAAREQLRAEQIPIATLAGVQYGAVLAAAFALGGEES